MGNETKGFASMSKAKRTEIARRGGKAAQDKGVAHRWTSEEAIKAGRKGGIVAKINRDRASEA